MDMVGLHGQFQNRPALLITLLANQVFTPLANLVHQHLSPALGTPDEVVDNQLRMVSIALVVQVARVVSPVDVLPQYLQNGEPRQTSGSSQRKPVHPLGLKAQRLYGLFCKYLGVTSHVFVARDLQTSKLDGDEGYVIGLEAHPLDALDDLIQSGALRDARAIAALLIARQWFGEG